MSRSRPSRARRHREGFTLVELLVVVAVISLLASLLMPMAVRAFAQSQKTECKSNLSQLGRSLMIYANTYEWLLPPFGYYTVGNSPPYRAPFWSETMAAFLYASLPRNERLHKAVRCPLYTRSMTYYSRGYTCNYGNVFRYYCPGYQGQGPLHDHGSMHVSEIHRAASTMLLMDGETGFCYTPLIWTRQLDRDGDGILDTYNTTVPLYNGGAPFRHDGACNVVFADGHVEPVRAREWLTHDLLWDPYP